MLIEKSAEVANALTENKAIVALESTIISHGMPYPQNVQTALEVEQIVRDCGAVPATIAIIGGKIKVGLSKDEIDYIGKKGKEVKKVSRRDIAPLCVLGQDGATTVAATMIIAKMAGISVFATGGIGGVHRGAQTTMDISADLDELSKTSVLVVCAGAKAILDLKLTKEYLETKGVTIVGYQTDELPAFYSRESGHSVDYNASSAEDVAKMFSMMLELDLQNGMLVTCPVPKQFEMPKEQIDEAIEHALTQAKKQNIEGKEVTPFLLAKVVELTKGDSLATNINLVKNNARIASEIAKDLVKIARV